MLDSSSRKMFNNTPTLIGSTVVTNLFVSNTLSEEEQFKVRAKTRLSVNSQTEIVSAHDFGLDYSHLSSHQIKIEICEFQSRLFPSGNLVNTSSWIKKIILATDHHCCNVELEAEKDGLVLKVTRTILPGEPLLMWFGERFRAIMDIPFLMSCHIEENLTYKCHLCDRKFDGPNPLKLHITLKCDKLTINYLWQSLAIKYKKSSFLMTNILTGSTNLSYQHLNYQLSSTPSIPYSDLVPKLLNPLMTSSSIETPFPFPVSTNTTNQDFNDTLRSFISSTTGESCTSHAISPMIFMGRQFKIKSEALTKHPDHISAFQMVSNCSLSNMKCGDYQMEQIEMRYSGEEGRFPSSDPLILENEASSNGKTNDGNYQCVVCHKRYSRKYGLKIHFRTHTGYKPLQCKFCGRAFGDPSNLNKHVRLHLNSENARYKCKYCDKGMVRRRDLERHIQKKHSSN